MHSAYFNFTRRPSGFSGIKVRLGGETCAVAGGSLRIFGEVGGVGGIDSCCGRLSGGGDTSIGLRASFASRNRRTVASARFLDSWSGGGGGLPVAFGLVGESASPKNDFQAIDRRDSN